MVVVRTAEVLTCWHQEGDVAVHALLPDGAVVASRGKYMESLHLHRGSRRIGHAEANRVACRPM